MQNTSAIPRSELGKGTKARIIVVPTAEAMQQAFVDDVASLLRERNAQGRSLSVILPVGPVQFRPLAERLNRDRLDLRRFYVFPMDEFCNETGERVSEDHPLSLRGFLRRELVDLLDPSLGFRAANLTPPDAANPSAYVHRMSEVGGVDVAYTGLGINGHLAFNEPEPEMDVEEYARLSVRLVRLSPATIVQMAMGGTDGDLLGIPSRAVTVGMRELLAAREIHGYFPRRWHSAALRRALHGPVTPAFPASYLQRHPNVVITVPAYVAEPPEIIVTQRL